MENHSGGQTTTRATVSETQVQTNLRFDPSYLRTIPGMLKLAAVVRFYDLNRKKNLFNMLLMQMTGVQNRSFSYCCTFMSQEKFD